MSPDHLLPPVEPPSAGFLVQLFLVPGLIVAIIVGVWLTFHWLAHLGQDPQAYVRTLRRDNEGRWQAALNLANDLRGPGGAVLKADATLAGELGRILADESKSGRTGEQSQMLRVYLCRALGEFTIPEALGPLLERAKDTNQPQVARAAIEAIAVLSTNLVAAGGSPSGTGVADAVVTASRSEDPGLRSAAAFALGVVGEKGTGPADGRLHALLADANDDVRYNAALALARLGDGASLDTLEEMLSLPDEPAPKPDARDDVAQSKRYKRALVVLNALRGLALLVDATPSPLPEGILAKLKSLSEDPVSDVRAGVTALEAKLARLTPAG
jgi:HEAT repeat protein